MPSLRWLILPSLALLVAAAAAACGGGSNGTPQTSGDADIPTATLPNPLPDPIIIGAGDVPGTETAYIVEAGDSPSSIAAQFGITADELMAANGISDPTALFVGQELTIPGAAPGPNVLGATGEPPATPEPAPVDPEPQAGGGTYIVQPGDIPETIAAQFGITADELMAANGISDPTSLQVGQELIIP